MVYWEVFVVSHRGHFERTLSCSCATHVVPAVTRGQWTLPDRLDRESV